MKNWVDISSITKGTATFIECSTAHGLAMNDIVKINLPIENDLATLLNGTTECLQMEAQILLLPLIVYRLMQILLLDIFHK